MGPQDSNHDSLQQWFIVDRRWPGLGFTSSSQDMNCDLGAFHHEVQIRHQGSVVGGRHGCMHKPANTDYFFMYPRYSSREVQYLVTLLQSLGHFIAFHILNTTLQGCCWSLPVNLWLYIYQPKPIWHFSDVRLMRYL